MAQEYQDFMTAVNNYCKLQHTLVKRREWIVNTLNELVEKQKSKERDLELKS